MKTRVVVSAAVAMALTASGCGGKTAATSTAAFSDQLATVCRTINRGIANLNAPASLDDVRSNATGASALYEEGLAELKKLSIPAGDKQFTSDVKDLITSFGEQLDTLDAIAKAAKENDQHTVNTRMSTLTDQASHSNQLADSLNISRCQIDPVFTTIDTTPPTTQPTVPLTLPIPPTTTSTIPPLTLPIATTTPATTSNKVVVSSAGLVPLGNYTFTDAPASATTGFDTLLDLAPSMAAQSGRITGIDVLDSSGAAMGRLFAFESDTTPLTPGSLDEVTPFVTNGTPASPKTVGTLDGVSWTDPDGTVNFLVGASNVVLWSFAPSQALLDATLQAWSESISQ